MVQSTNAQAFDGCCGDDLAAADIGRLHMMDLEAVLAAGEHARFIEAELLDVHGPDFGELDEVLKVGPETVVFSGRFNNRNAVFKRLLTADAEAKLDTTKTELAYLTQALREGPHRVAPWLASLPESKTLVLGKVPGERASLLLKTSNRHARSDTISLCAGWLGRVAPMRSEQRPFRPHNIVRRFSESDVRGQGDAAGIISNTIEQMTRLGRRHRGKPIAFSVAHGDFAPVNLNIDGATVWAFDIHGGHYRPLARTMAWFLVAACITWPSAVGPLGLDPEDLAAFDTANVLPADDRENVFAFFVAEQFLRNVLSRNLTGDRLEIAVSRLKSLNEHLANLGDT